MDSFVNLHTHFDFSPLDGAQKVKDGFARAAELGQPALAITDHGSMSGHWDAWKAGAATGVKSILGVEAYVAPKDLRTHEAVHWGTPEQSKLDIGGRGKATHQTMFALNSTGLRNLYKMQYIAATEGFYGYPRVDMDLMAQHSEGVLVTSGCAGSAISIRIRLGQWDKAVELASDLKSIYGENFFIEVMDHGISEPDLNDLWLNARLVKLAKMLDVPVVATNDAHYCLADDNVAHDAFLAIQTHAQLNDPKRFRFNGAGYHLKSAAEMQDKLRYVTRHSPDAIKNTLVIAERVESYDSHFEFKNRMPHLPEIHPDMEDDYLAHLVWKSYEDEGREPTTEERVRDEYELEVIGGMGFPGYFIVLADVINWAKGEGIRVGPGRGSAGGSHVCYRIGITGIDPLLHGLPFERFLNPERVSLPDIDVDFEIARRGEVVEYTKRRFGEKNVVKILTLGTIKAKAAIKDAGGLLGWDFETRNHLTKLFPDPIHGFSPDLDCVFDPNHPRYGDARALRNELNDVKGYMEIYELARKIEGLIRNFGVHAAGLIISSEPLDDIIPLRLPTGKDKESDTDLVTGFDANAMEPLGLIKYDYLGLENLTTINVALDYIEQVHGTKVVVEELPLDDMPTYAMLSRGNSLGVFQLDSPGMQRLLKRLAPKRFSDISAVLALYRPGPMGVGAHEAFADRANGRQKVDLIHHEFGILKELLAETHGVIVYQEQIMAVLVELADYTPGQADMVRRIMGKKKPAEMAKLEPELREKMKAKGYSDEAFEALWEVLVPFADYSFNKAHTAAYGLISYWTAYLKCHYPAEYFAALLSTDKAQKEQETLTTYLNDARKNGVAILPPDINESSLGFTPTTHGIRFGLKAIKGVGPAVIEAVKEMTIGSLDEFYANIPGNVNARSLQCLIQAGTFDSFGDRVDHAAKSQSFIERAKDAKKAIEHGDRPVLRGRYKIQKLRSDLKQMQEWELELLGTEITTPNLTVDLQRELSEEEWIWVNTVLAGAPGKERVTFSFKGVRFTSCQTVAGSDRISSMLSALDGLRVELS